MRKTLIFVSLVCLLAATPAAAQIYESVGIRATGMGGAFVAVADDSTATWWNPAGLAIGPFVDATVGRTTTELKDRIPARRDHVFWVAVTAPAIGFSYYRLKITDIRRIGPTGQPLVGRQDPRAEVSVRSLSASQLGL